MADFTLFVGPTIETYSEKIVDPDTSSYIGNVFCYEDPTPTKFYSVETIALDSGDSRTIDFGTTILADKKFLFLKVVGSAQIRTVAKDTDGTTTINGYLAAYGVEAFPGLIYLSTYNITSATVNGLADSTTVDLLAAITDT